MNDAKISLSNAEKELVGNADWILTKNGILEKIKHLLSGIQQSQLEYINAEAPNLFPPSEPKISKGENYKGLPYLVLDFPRFFANESVFAIRTMFWWGHYFSITLQLSGINKLNWEENIIRAYPEIAGKGFYYCIHGDPWEHHFESDNYRKVAEIEQGDFKNSIRHSEFIKLAAKIELDHWEDISQILLEKFVEMISWLRN